MAGRLSFILIVLVAVLAPLPFGSSEFRSVAIWCILLSVSLACADLSLVRQAQRRVLLIFFTVATLGAIVLIAQSSLGRWLGLEDPVRRETINLLGISAPR